jgi:hypothetical protein
MMGFATFMASGVGRGIRIVAGLVLIAVGGYLAFAKANVGLGVILAVVGLVPLAAGALDVCIFAPLFRAPFSGAKVRQRA